MSPDAGAARPGPISRRRLLRWSAAAAMAVPAATWIGTAPAAAALPGPPIRPRADWAGDRAPTGPMPSERDGDVRFLLVHHSVSANDYGRDDVPGLIRGFYDAHTAKGWPDVAYNFFVDRFGGVWEGRAGSRDGPVIADATGGNQGFSQLACLIGDFRAQPPSQAALGSLTGVLAALADRYRIDTAPDARVAFVSRGSNRWPEGSTVTTPTIAGHRDMSRTECPGDACYALIRGPITTRVDEIRDGSTTPAAAPVVGAPAPGAPPTIPPEPGDDTAPTIAAASVAAATATAAVAGGAVWARSRRTRATLRPGDPAARSRDPHER